MSRASKSPEDGVGSHGKPHRTKVTGTHAARNHDLNFGDTFNIGTVFKSLQCIGKRAKFINSEKVMS